MTAPLQRTAMRIRTQDDKVGICSSPQLLPSLQLRIAVKREAIQPGGYRNTGSPRCDGLSFRTAELLRVCWLPQ